MKALKYLTYLLLGASLTFASCESFIEGHEIDPNNPADADPVNMIQGVMLADVLFHTGDLARISSMWIHQATGVDRQYTSLDNWNEAPAATYDATWSILYSGVVANSRIVQDKTTASKNIKLRGVAKVLEAHALGTATSLWGDIPNTEAANIEEFPNPSYDSQESVYAYVQQTLTSAIADLEDPLGSIPVDKDIFFEGSASNWVLLANSLKARYYVHTSDWANAALYASQGIQAPENDLVAPFGSVYGGSFNPWYSFNVYDRSGYMNAHGAYAVDLLNPESDNYRGNEKTDESRRLYWNYQDFGWNAFGAGIWEPNYFNLFDGWGYQGKFGAEMPLVTYAEMLLIQAEASLRLNELPVNALETLNTYRAYLNSAAAYHNNPSSIGVAEEYNAAYEPYLLTDFAPDGIADKGKGSLEGNLLHEILEERYIHFIGDFEAFTDIRRTDNYIGIPIKLGNQIVQRFLYPQTEINANRSVPTPMPDYNTPTPVNM